jgi:hypothetical protein
MEDKDIDMKDVNDGNDNYQDIDNTHNSPFNFQNNFN